MRRGVSGLHRALWRLGRWFVVYPWAREEEVMTWIDLGKTSLWIAKRLNTSESTIKTYAQRIYTKLGVHTKVERSHSHEYDLGIVGADAPADVASGHVFQGGVNDERVRCGGWRRAEGHHRRLSKEQQVNPVRTVMLSPREEEVMTWIDLGKTSFVVYPWAAGIAPHRPALRHGSGQG